jgi:hypothetical protein
MDLSSHPDLVPDFTSPANSLRRNSLLAPLVLLNGWLDACLGSSAGRIEAPAADHCVIFSNISFMTGVLVLANSQSEVLPYIVWHT